MEPHAELSVVARGAVGPRPPAGGAHHTAHSQIIGTMLVLLGRRRPRRGLGGRCYKTFANSPYAATDVMAETTDANAPRARLPAGSSSPPSVGAAVTRRRPGGMRVGFGRNRRAKSDAPPRTLLAACFVAALLVAAPVMVTIVQAVQGGFSVAGSSIGSTSTLTLMLHSLEVAAAAAPICAVIGVGAAWFVERTTLPGRRLWAVLFVAPLTIPPFVTSYAWANFGPPFQGFVGAAGIIAFSYYPIVFLLVAVALRGLDPALEETGRRSG